MALYPSPFMANSADPYLYRHTDGTYYFTASAYTYDKIVLRSARSVREIPSATPKTVWKKPQSGECSAHVWAPELHFIMGKWVIYFASGRQDDIWRIRPYVLVCKGNDPMRDEWEAPVPMRSAQNDPYSFTDFSLDMTVFFHNGEWYAVWAQKVGTVSGISNLYLAQMESPTQLKTVQVMLSTPDYDWERQGGFWVNEGPAIVKQDGKIHLFFSASATGAEYCMGTLTADEGANLLDPRSWKKHPLPIFHTDKKHQIYGPGHNSFCLGDEGELLCILHFRNYEKIEGDPLYDYNRHAHLLKITFDNNGLPRFSYANNDLYNSPFENI